MITHDDLRDARLALGQLLAELRKTAGLTQHRLADAVYASRSSVAGIETGRQNADREFWIRADHLTNANGTLLTGYDDLRNLQHQRLRHSPPTPWAEIVPSLGQSSPPPVSGRSEAGYLAGLLRDGVIRVMHGCLDDAEQDLYGGGLADTRQVKQAVAGLHDAYQRADYASAVDRTIVAVAATHHLAIDGTASDAWADRSALRLNALANIAASKLANKLSDPEMAWTLADRGAMAARLADDHTLLALATYQAACALQRTPTRINDALQITLQAVDNLSRRPAEGAPRLSVHGSLLLLAAILYARTGYQQECRQHLTRAKELADELGHDGNELWTGFGPTNVAIHELGAAVSSSAYARAVGIGDRLDTSRMPAALVGRRAQVHIDLAAACANGGGDEQTTLLHLLEAERIAPQLVRIHRTARAAVEKLVSHPRHNTPGLTALAIRTGVLQ